MVDALVKQIVINLLRKPPLELAANTSSTFHIIEPAQEGTHSPIHSTIYLPFRT
jgi:hypothetical protein